MQWFHHLLVWVDLSEHYLHPLLFLVTIRDQLFSNLEYVYFSPQLLAVQFKSTKIFSIVLIDHIYLTSFHSFFLAILTEVWDFHTELQFYGINYEPFLHFVAIISAFYFHFLELYIFNEIMLLVYHLFVSVAYNLIALHVRQLTEPFNF